MESYRPMNELEIASSLESWWPIIKELGIDVPKTKIVPLTNDQIRTLANERVPPRVVKKIKRAAEEFGTPFFLRTDQSSAKHSWVSTCFVNSLNNLSKHIHEIVQFHMIADIFGIPFHSFVVREFIPLEAAFKAFDGMPIAKERRYFIIGGKVQCHHEYWVEGAVKQGMAGKGVPEKEWFPKMEALNHEDEAEVEELTSIATMVAQKVKGYWSVDFAKAKDGRWLLIDMARGELSYHKPDCSFAPKGIMERI